MLALIDLSVIFIVAGCLLYFQNEKGAFPCSGAAIPRRWERRLQAATPGWRQELPDHWLLQLAPRQGPGCDQGLGMKTGTKMC
jgi:hypothetical protein